ncbi:hypothetical protein [Deinococcus kurensis]|uniref:hypothetical protein n=1 Tax=Deinococcus kurensis TaxID=2662757 RepID=UPI0012D33EF5|nr:hypothetical protein [Deinococcus kurensis]
MTPSETPSTPAARIFRIRDVHYSDALYTLAASNRTARRLGSPESTLTVLDTIHTTYYHPDDVLMANPQPRTYFRVELTGAAAPSYDGWTFEAAVDPARPGDATGRTAALIRTRPDTALTDAQMADLRHQGDVCDHCGKARKRAEVFIVRHTDGNVKRVGRNCMRDFLGHADPAALMRRFELELNLAAAMGDLEDGADTRAFRPREHLSVLDVAATAVSLVRQDGRYLTASAAAAMKTMSTAALTVHALTDSKFYVPQRDRSGLMVPPSHTRPTEADYAQARVMLDWARGLTDVTGYLHNLHALATAQIVSLTHARLLASLPAGFQGMEARKAEADARKAAAAARAAADAASVHVGTVGKRQEFTLTVDRVVDISGDYGYCALYLMRDERGNRVTLKTGALDLDEGRTYRLKATVKAHDDYKGTAQTAIQRAAVLDTLDATGATAA